MATVLQALALGSKYHEEGRLALAERCYRQVLETDPNVAKAWCLLGAINQVHGRVDESVANYERALRLDPNLAEARNNLGLALATMGRSDEAIACYRRALQIKPRYPDAYNNLGNELQASGQHTEAVAAYRRGLEFDLCHADLHHNLGNALRAMGRLAEALAAYNCAVNIRPEHARYRLSRALALLEAGDFERGWPEYESRWECPECALPAFPQPVWNGDPLEGRTILLYADHGIGDTIQFIRFARRVKERGGAVIAACRRPLVRLLQRCPGVDQVVTEGDPLPQFDVYAPVMSLPHILKTTMADVTADVAYLRTEPEVADGWRSALGPRRGLRVGIAWQGNPEFPLDHLRSFALDALHPIAEVPGLELFSIQKGAGTEQLPEWHGATPITDLSAQLNDLMDTAGLLRNLDLVIVPDSSLAHLAGALAVPVWVALPFAPDWRWMRDRDDSPWYPTMRLFRQTEWDHWGGVFERMAGVLRSGHTPTA
jgi:Flp pilus assembly protein TadD